MKKNINTILASPYFFHIAVSVLYILLLVSALCILTIFPVGFYDYGVILATLLFSALYPFLAIGLAILVRRTYTNTYQAQIPEEFVDELVLYNRYVLSVIYAVLLIVGFFGIGYTTIFWIIGFLLFYFFVFVLPVFIRYVLLKKINFIGLVIILGVFFISFLVISYLFWFMLGSY